MLTSEKNAAGGPGTPFEIAPKLGSGAAPKLAPSPCAKLSLAARAKLGSAPHAKLMRPTARQAGAGGATKAVGARAKGWRGARQRLGVGHRHPAGDWTQGALPPDARLL